VTVLAEELGPKKLELLHELLPKTNILGLLVNPTNPAATEPATRELQAAPTPSGCNSKSCLQAPKATSIRSSQLG
jgi:hypothetical protein